MVALIPSPNETVSATTLANCNPSPSVQSSAPAATIGNIAGRMLAAITRHERNARPMNAATKTTSTVSPRLSFSNHDCAVAGSDGGQAGNGYRKAGVLRTDRSKRFVERPNDRTYPAGVKIRDAARNDDGVLIGGDEAPDQILRQGVNVLLQGGDVAFSGLLGEPAPQGLK